MQLTTVFPSQASLELFRSSYKFLLAQNYLRGGKSLHPLLDFLVIPVLPVKQSVTDRENQNPSLPL